MHTVCHPSARHANCNSDCSMFSQSLKATVVRINSHSSAEGSRCAVLLSLVTPVRAQTSPDGALAAEFQVEFNGQAMARDTIEIFPKVDGTVSLCSHI